MVSTQSVKIFHINESNNWYLVSIKALSHGAIWVWNSLHLAWFYSLVIIIPFFLQGHPEPVVSWTHNGGPLSNDAEVKTSLNKTTLIIPRVNQTHAGHYTCLIENDAGSAQCTCDVIVKSKLIGLDKAINKVKFSNKLEPPYVRILCLKWILLICYDWLV